MKNWVHIARKTFLLAIVLLIGYSYAHAQNNWQNPYIDSWQKYRVPVGTVGNGIEWTISCPAYNGGTPITLTDGATQGGVQWVRSSTETVGTETYAYVEIKFIGHYFTNGQTWTLLYTETSTLTGLCTALRSVEMNIVDNTFYLELADDDDECNTLDGEVLNWNDIDTETMVSYVDFRINMHKATDFAMNSWSFTGSLALLDANYTFASVDAGTASVLNGTSNAGGAYTISASAASFTVTVNVPGTVTDTDYIEIRVGVRGLVYEGETVQLTVSNGKAHSGSDYPSETDDNTDLPTGGDRIQEMTILPLPATPNIAIVN